ncbi:MAG: alpha-hydroxy-acid oxidizing protein [Gammaproteobacteria bacterium]|nr:alpha-hydroxy-acid oxidizing protein [Gammaproteobacteria bacterium]MBT8109731.1 alpha-hydroxy-acid oxidizing protein [Gammaproteobacteria bacterium]NND47647.1 alpha-hydroxy-acid oxidizing protein [Woeseiaceae bacterium]NNL44432.1 alpha-hydroxy-acid oxidizing protein [Woeseiaceae bacterium]
MRIKDCNNIMDFRHIARRRLPASVFHYLDGGADDEWSLARNTDAFNDYELLPSQLSDVSNIDLKSTLFGQAVDWPVMIAPTGASKLFHRDGESAVIRAAEKFGMIYSLSTLGTTTIEDAADAGQCPKMFQVYVFKDRGLTKEFVDRCKAKNFTALCLTVDTPVAGNRERDIVYGVSAKPRLTLKNIIGYARHPGWVYRALVRKDLDLVNVTSSDAGGQMTSGAAEYINSQFDRSLTWKDVEWLAGQWDGPLVIKGVQTVADCRNAANSGATAVMLSNHGGRQLESAPAPVDCIASVADALGDRLEIICDGGIRRGTHVAKALALGANACSIGRGYLYPLAAGGQAGVERGLLLLRTELERTMALVGCDRINKLGERYIQHRR